MININEAKVIFGKRGYAAKRNAVLYKAIKDNMDYMAFLDDDEYPMAVTNTRNTAIWGGQEIFVLLLKLSAIMKQKNLLMKYLKQKKLNLKKVS